MPSARVKTPPVGIESTVIVRVSPASESVGAPIEKLLGVSSVNEKEAFAPILGALLVFGVGAGGDSEPPPPPPPQDARASTARLENKKDEGPFSSKRFVVPFGSFFRRSRNCFSSILFNFPLISPILCSYALT